MLEKIDASQTMDPFLKWAGGKRWLAKSTNQFYPINYKRYIEPFVGSGAIFFNMDDCPFIIADANAELISCYMAIRDDYKKVHDSLTVHARNHNKEYYYKIRSSKPRTVHTSSSVMVVPLVPA